MINRGGIKSVVNFTIDENAFVLYLKAQKTPHCCGGLFWGFDS